MPGQLYLIDHSNKCVQQFVNRKWQTNSYWFKYIIVTPNQLTAAALVIQFWVDRDRVNPGVFIAIFLVLICCINYFGIRFFGEFEFWLSSFKVIIIVIIILFSLVLALGGGPDHDRKGFRYWNNPGYVYHPKRGNWRRKETKRIS